MVRAATLKIKGGHHVKGHLEKLGPLRICANLSYGNKIRGVRTMGQFGFFDADRRLAAMTAKGDPLEMIARVVPFESFRAEIEAAVFERADKLRCRADFLGTSTARKPCTNTDPDARMSWWGSS